MNNPPLTYTWGNGCKAYVLLQSAQCSVKRETIPHGAGEVMHMHREAQQLFYVLKGEGIFNIDEMEHIVSESGSIHIPPGTKHLVANRSDELLELLVISQPDTAGDRINLE